MVDHQARHHVFGQRVVAGARLRVDEGEVPVLLEREVPHVGELEAQGPHHFAVLRPPHDAPVPERDLLLEVPEHLGQQGRGGEGVRVGVVVREDQPAAGLLARRDVGFERRVPLPGNLADHARKIFPGLRMPWGSKLAFTRRINSRAGGDATSGR